LHPEWQVRIGQDYFYTYIIPEKVEVKTSKMGNEVKKEIDVMAFDEFTKIDFKIDYERLIERNITMKCDAIYEAMGWKQVEVKVKKEKVVKEVKVKKVKEAKVIGSSRERESILISNQNLPLPPIKEVKKVEIKEHVHNFHTTSTMGMTTHEQCGCGEYRPIKKEETIKLNHSFKTQAEITERTIMVAEAFGLGIDDEKSFTIYDNAEVKIKTGDIVYITGDSGSGKSWLLQNVFAKMPNAISINDLQIDDNEVVVEGVGKDLSDALMKLNVAGLGDAFLYLRKYSQLSDGQKYRYRVAKFIDNEDKDIWICDEFCATLDRVTAKVVAYNIQKIARKLNKTVIVATTHVDLLNEIRPNVHILKGYESEVNINYYKTEDWANQKLEFYNDMKVEVGERKDYDALKKFHYRQAALGAVKKIYKCTYKDELVGAIVITYPHLALKGRNIFLNGKYNKMTKENCDALNAEFECIARVVVLPKYRGIGLSYYFLKEYFKLTDIKYTETLAVMARYTPFFERAGMTRIDVETDEKREKMIEALVAYGFNTDLLASSRYFNSVYDKLNDTQKEEVKNIVINILDKYKGQIVTLQKTDWKPNWKEYVKHIARADTIYLIKQLHD